MFRIDRRFVKLTGTRVAARTAFEDKKEAGAGGESPEKDAAASDEIIAALLASTDVHAAAEAAAAAAFEADGDIGDSDEADTDTDADTESDDIFDDPAENEAEDRARLYMVQAEKAIEEREEKIITEAHAQAAKIIEDAEHDAKEIRERAREEGYAEGFEEGKQKGEEEGRHAFDDELAEKLAQDTQELKNVLDEVARERARLESEQEADTVALALEIVKKIIKPAEEELGTVFSSLIKNAFRQLPSEGKFVIRVAQSEYDRFFPSGVGEIELDSGAKVTATVLRDAALEEGDLIIDADEVTVNAGIDSQLKYVQLAFEEAQNMVDEEEEE